MTGGELHLDPSPALAVPGVKGVYWSENTAGFVSNWTQYGIPVAAVCAEDWEIARYACSLIDIEWGALPVVFDADDAMDPGSPLSGRSAGSNFSTSTFTRGDVDVGFDEADVIVNTDQPWTPTMQHNPLQPKIGLAHFIGDDCYAYVHNQSSMTCRAGVASAVNLPLHKVHAQCHTCGGGHGDGGGPPQANLAAIISQKLDGHPVCVKLSRQDHNHIGRRQYDVRSNNKIGVKQDGTITAWQGTWYGNGGGATGWGALRTTYTIPRMANTGHTISTNEPPRGAWRCVADPPGAHQYDAALDKVATELNMDPYQLRLKNLRGEFEPAQDSPYRYWSSNATAQCLDKAYVESGYAAKWHQPGAKTLADGRLHGIAITGHLDGHGSVGGQSRYGHLRMAGQENAGQCIFYLGGGKVHNAAAAMQNIVAEVLGLKYTDVSLGEHAHSDINFDTGMQAGSSHTGGAGSGFFRAALEMRNRLFERAITRSPFNAIDGITVDDLEAKNSEVFYKTDPTIKVTHAQIVSGWAPQLVVSKGWNASGTAAGDGIQRTKPGLPVEVGERVNVDVGAATCIEVAVDPETGDVEILGMWNAIDTGYNISALAVKGQIGAAWEVLSGQTMYYGDVYDPQTAAVLGMSFGSYMHPTTLDLNSDNFHGYAIENDDVAGPCGGRGIGEPCITNASAVTCAIYNAIGAWMDWEHGAGTADKILKALGKA